MGKPVLFLPKHGNSKWSDEHYVECYRMAREGMLDTSIAKALGVSELTFYKWKKRNRALRKALKRGRQIQGESSNFKNYFFDRLPPELQDVWHKIEACQEESNVIERLQNILTDCGERGTQHIFLYALVRSDFNLTKTCKKVGIKLAKFRNWCFNDPEFAALVNEIEEAKKDFFEGALITKVQEGDTTSILFANRTKNSDRGYGIKKQVTQGADGELKPNKVSINDLGLSTDGKRELLQKYRDARKKNATEIKQIK